MKAGVVPTKNGLKRHESDKPMRDTEEEKKKKERRVTEEETKRKNKSQIVLVVSALSVEIRTGNCSKSITV